jgi:hypothetical protein
MPLVNWETFYGDGELGIQVQNNKGAFAQGSGINKTFTASAPFRLLYVPAAIMAWRRHFIGGSCIVYLRFIVT